jgi:hypothetical protein
MLLKRLGGELTAMTYEIPVRPTHDNLEKAAVTGIDSLYLQAIAPDLKPVVKMTKQEYQFVQEQDLIDEELKIHAINGTVYLIHPIAGRLDEVKSRLNKGDESELLGYPQKGNSHIAVTKQGEIILDTFEMGKEGARHNLIWGACGTPKELIDRANRISEVIRRVIHERR